MNETEPLWTGRPDPPPMPAPVQSRRPRKSVLAVFSLIPIGVLMWFVGMGVGLGGGEQWVVAIATYCFLAGLPIAAAGFIWLVIIAIADLVNR